MNRREWLVVAYMVVSFTGVMTLLFRMDVASPWSVASHIGLAVLYVLVLFAVVFGIFNYWGITLETDETLQ